jgi:hypothetical protein
VHTVVHAYRLAALGLLDDEHERILDDLVTPPLELHQQADATKMVQRLVVVRAHAGA